MKHAKCGNPLYAKAKVASVLFNTYTVLLGDNLGITPTQILGDNVVFEFEEGTVYCRSCEKDIPLDSEELIVGVCPECQNIVTPKDSEIIVYGGESALVTHKACVDKVIETFIKGRGIEEFTKSKLSIRLKEI